MSVPPPQTPEASRGRAVLRPVAETVVDVPRARDAAACSAAAAALNHVQPRLFECVLGGYLDTSDCSRGAAAINGAIAKTVAPAAARTRASPTAAAGKAAPPAAVAASVRGALAGINDVAHVSISESNVEELVRQWGSERKWKGNIYITGHGYALPFRPLAFIVG